MKISPAILTFVVVVITACALTALHVSAMSRLAKFSSVITKNPASTATAPISYLRRNNRHRRVQGRGG